MADCYEGKCEGCKRPIPIRVGGFSTSRSGVRAFCPSCRDAFVKAICDEAHFGRACDGGLLVFADVQKGGPYQGQCVLFLVSPPHNITVNGNLGDCDSAVGG